MAFKHRYPGLRLSVQEAGTRSLQRMIRNGELDLGVVVADQPGLDLEVRPFLREEMVVCAPVDHVLAGCAGVSLAQLFEHELVVSSPGYFLREFVDRCAGELGKEPRIAFETNLIPLAKAIVRQGFGVTTVLRMVVDPQRDRDLTAIPFDPPRFLELSLAWRRNAYLPLANRAFVEFVLEQTTRDAR